jgi:hypothetical protein
LNLWAEYQLQSGNIAESKKIYLQLATSGDKKQDLKWRSPAPR